MTSLMWLALALVALWIVVKFVFRVVGGIVHLLLVIAIVVFAASFFM